MHRAKVEWVRRLRERVWYMAKRQQSFWRICCNFMNQRPQNLSLQALSLFHFLEQAHAMRIAQGKDMKGMRRWCRKA